MSPSYHWGHQSPAHWGAGELGTWVSALCALHTTRRLSINSNPSHVPGLSFPQLSAGDRLSCPHPAPAPFSQQTGGGEARPWRRGVPGIEGRGWFRAQRWAPGTPSPGQAEETRVEMPPSSSSVRCLAGHCHQGEPRSSWEQGGHLPFGIPRAQGLL